VELRTWIERVSAERNEDVLHAIARWKTMRRAGWELTVLHRYKPTPMLVTFGHLPCGRKRSWASGS
jgi:hypothetical protein